MDGANEASQEISSLSPGEKLNFGQRIPMSFAYVISLERWILKFLSVILILGELDKMIISSSRSGVSSVFVKIVCTALKKAPH
jgi:hypothetical protein